MSSAEALERAIQAARAGRKEEARKLLLEIVEAEPRNERYVPDTSFGKRYLMSMERRPRLPVSLQSRLDGSSY